VLVADLGSGGGTVRPQGICPAKVETLSASIKTTPAQPL
jgi:hypothetical protein